LLLFAMRSALSLTIAFVLTCALSLSATTAQAQGAFASNATFVSSNNGSNGGSTTAPSAGEKVVLTGKITNPAGVLPGAVVILTASKQMAVTNAEGEFEFTVPANAGALEAVVTYAGYADEKMTLNASADESTVSLTNARVVVISRRNQLKKYLKTAHKQVKHDLKQLHKN
jgi:hypothetical protein